MAYISCLNLKKEIARNKIIVKISTLENVIINRGNTYIVLNSLTARAEKNNLPGTATAVSSLDLEALWIRLTLPLIAST